MALYELLRPAMRLWYALQLKAGMSVPRPRDVPSWRTAEPGSDAVLLLGNGPCHGWGVATHGLALTGQLARAMTARTGRGCSVDYIGDETMNLESALPWVGNHELGAYDALVVVIGVNDAVRVTPVAEWASRLRVLLDTLLDRAAPGVRIVLAGIQPPRSLPVYDSPLGGVADRHAEALNGASRSVAADYRRVEYLPFAAVRLDRLRPFGSPQAYAEWAGPLADAAVPLVETARAGARAERALPDLSPVAEWAGMEKAVELAAEGGSPELQRIVARARALFGVEIATVSLLDGDRLRYMVPGPLPSAVPLELTFCNEAVGGPEPMIVPDARKDPRFAGNPLLELGHVQFYAGHPLQSLAGQTIGTLCLMGVRPKAASSIDLRELRSLAFEAQDELWRIERESAQLAEKTTRSR